MKRIYRTRELLDAIRKAGPDGKHREIADLQEGFGARITPNGAISFYYRYTGWSGKHRRQTIGAYPAMTVSEARRGALERRGRSSIQATRQPIVRKRECAHRTEQAAKIVPTIAGFVDDHYARRLRAGVKTADRTIVELRKPGKAFPGAMIRISVNAALIYIRAEFSI
jgi:hypothetical protein